jgi:hypothetical protein
MQRSAGTVCQHFNWASFSDWVKVGLNVGTVGLANTCVLSDVSGELIKCAATVSSAGHWLSFVQTVIEFYASVCNSRLWYAIATVRLQIFHCTKLPCVTDNASRRPFS